MTQSWVTVVVGFLSAIAGVAGALGAQLVSARQVAKQAKVERDAQWDDRDRQERRASYARMLVAARLLEPTVRVFESDAIDRALTALREAAADVELANSQVWDDHASEVLDSAERWVAQALREGPTSSSFRDAQARYRATLVELRDRMRADLNNHDHRPNEK
ncbi:MAG TPA: hypothetical protein VHX38_14150 [Pseudonocardiaceae bacterium]|jgi:hypothetical protein|nr:hypothetical protein [Pseudonocardiaceae bacterium]